MSEISKVVSFDVRIEYNVSAEGFVDDQDSGVIVRSSGGSLTV